MAMTPEERQALDATLAAKYRHYDIGASAWSTLHHGTLYLAAIGSAAAAVFLKLDALKDWAPRYDFSAVLAALAAVLTTLAASGGFERKWRANRLARGRIEELRIDLTADLADAADVRQRLKNAMEAEDQAVLGNKG